MMVVMTSPQQPPGDLAVVNKYKASFVNTKKSPLNLMRAASDHSTTCPQRTVMRLWLKRDSAGVRSVSQQRWYIFLYIMMGPVTKQSLCWNFIILSMVICNSFETFWQTMQLVVYWGGFIDVGCRTQTPVSCALHAHHSPRTLRSDTSWTRTQCCQWIYSRQPRCFLWSVFSRTLVVSLAM